MKSYVPLDIIEGSYIYSSLKIVRKLKVLRKSFSKTVRWTCVETYNFGGFISQEHACFSGKMAHTVDKVYHLAP